jgi:hypothetical protein
MNIKLSIVLALLIAMVFPATAIYAWHMRTRVENYSEFKVVVNGVRELDLIVPVNVKDGLTREEAERIAEVTFTQVLGEKALHRLDTLKFDEHVMEAHYTWGLDENDMGHVFDMSVDLTSSLISVTHCR